MKIASWKTIVTRLSLGGLALAACDERKLGDESMAQPSATETDGETETDSETDEPPPETTVAPETDGEPTDTNGEPAPEICNEYGASRECATEDGQSGIQYCFDSTVTAQRNWGQCLTAPRCVPGESRSCCGDEGGESTGGSETGGDSGGICDVSEYCDLYGDTPDWDSNQSIEAGCNTPLVLSFDGRPAQLTPARAATFDLDGIGGCITTDWPEAATPWLALDRDGNGSIDSGRELFGSGTRLRSGERAPHGFAALAELDDSGDGRIDMADEGFSQLVLWGDHDGDRRSTFAEAEPLSHQRILSIELGFHRDSQCDDRGNCGVERAAFHYVDEHGAVQEGEVVDLHLACQ
jgi:hypothetical protein